MYRLGRVERSQSDYICTRDPGSPANLGSLACELTGRMCSRPTSMGMRVSGSNYFDMKSLPLTHKILSALIQWLWLQPRGLP